jgi:hypothetical protein
MPAPLPPDQLTIIRNLLANGDTAGAIKVYSEATGATPAEAKSEVNNLASRYGLVGAQLPDLFVRRTPPPPPKSAPAIEKPAEPTMPPSTPAPVAQQAANVPLEPAPAPVPPPAPAPARPPTPVPVSPDPEAVAAARPTQAAPPVSVPKPKASPVSSPKPQPAASSPSTKKSRWGCSSAIVLFGGVVGIAWWALA